MVNNLNEALKVLNLNCNFTEEELRNNYRNSIKLYHHDKYANRSKEIQEEALKNSIEINLAYDYLLNYLKYNQAKKRNGIKTNRERIRAAIVKYASILINNCNLLVNEISKNNDMTFRIYAEHIFSMYRYYSTRFMNNADNYDFTTFKNEKKQIEEMNIEYVRKYFDTKVKDSNIPLEFIKDIKLENIIHVSRILTIISNNLDKYLERYFNEEILKYKSHKNFGKNEKFIFEVRNIIIKNYINKKYKSLKDTKDEFELIIKKKLSSNYDVSKILDDIGSEFIIKYCFNSKEDTITELTELTMLLNSIKKEFITLYDFNDIESINTLKVRFKLSCEMNIKAYIERKNELRGLYLYYKNNKLILSYIDEMNKNILDVTEYNKYKSMVYERINQKKDIKNKVKKKINDIKRIIEEVL